METRGGARHRLILTGVPEEGHTYPTYPVAVEAQHRCAHTSIRFHLPYRETIVQIGTKSLIKNPAFSLGTSCTRAAIA